MDNPTAVPSPAGDASGTVHGLPVVTPPHGQFHIVVTDNEADWHHARTFVVTATDAARLATLNQNEWNRVRAEKAGEVAPFGGNAATEWGHEREPAIMAHIATIDPTVKPNDRLCIKADDHRFGATPDGFNDGGDATGQAKTSNRPLDPHNPGRRYFDQIQWELLVTGAACCYLAIEEHDGHGNIIGTRTAVHWADTTRQAELVAIAERFLAGGPAIPVTTDDTIAAAIDDWAEAKEKEKAAMQHADAMANRVRALIGDEKGEWSSGAYVVKRAAPTVKKNIDAKALRSMYGSIAEQVTKETTVAGALSSPKPVKTT